MILSLFGPDGVGKSTVSQSLRETGWQVFSGTGVASWPDQTWHLSLMAQGVDETSLDDEKHFLEKIQRAHQLARNLESKHGGVVIDSDPLHKTLVHDYQKLLPNTQQAKLRLCERLAQLNKIVGSSHQKLIHIYFQIDKSDNTLRQAEILQERLKSRRNLAYFDPRNIEESQASIKAYRELKAQLDQGGSKVLTITTDQPFVLGNFLNQLAGN